MNYLCLAHLATWRVALIYFVCVRDNYCQTTMLHRLRTLLLMLAFGKELRGLEVFAKAFGLDSRPGARRCAYCQKASWLVEVPGPLGVGGVLVCRECSRACISFTA